MLSVESGVLLAGMEVAAGHSTHAVALAAHHPLDVVALVLGLVDQLFQEVLLFLDQLPAPELLDVGVEVVLAGSMAH